MKKFFMSVIAILTVTVFGVIGAGCEGDTENPDVPPVEKELVPVTDSLNENLSDVMVSDLRGMENRSYAAVNKLFDGVMFGQLIDYELNAEKEANPDFERPAFGYFDNGKWYLKVGDKLKEFDRDMNAVFGYDMGGKKPLDLMAGDLSTNGDKKLVELIGRQLNFDLAKFLSEGEQTATKKLLNDFLKMTENDFFNETKAAPDHTFTDAYMDNHTVADVIDAAIEQAAAKNAPAGEKPDLKPFDSMKALLNEVLSGRLSDIQFKRSVKVDTLITVLKDAALAQGGEDPDKLALIGKCFDDAILLFDGTTDNPVLHETEQMNLTVFINEALILVTGKEDNSEAALMMVDFIDKSKALSGKINELTPEEQAAGRPVALMKEYILDLTGYTAENQPGEEADAFISMLALAVMENVGHAEAPVNTLIPDYGTKNLVEIDGYLNHYVGRFLNVFGVPELLSTNFGMDLNEVLAGIDLNKFLTFVDNPVNLIDYIFTEFMKPHMDALLAENEAATLRDYDTAYLNGMLAGMEADNPDITAYMNMGLGLLSGVLAGNPLTPEQPGLIGQFRNTVENIKSAILEDKTLKELDEAFVLPDENGHKLGVYTAIAEADGCGSIMNLKISQFRAFLDDNADEETLTAVDNLNLKFIMDAVKKLSENFGKNATTPAA